MPSVSSVRAHLSVALVNLLVLGGALLWVRDPRATAVLVEPRPSPSPAPSATPVRLHVYVTGAVESAKVVALDEGARAEDAVRACGGFASDADPAMVNLAAPLADGQHLHVPAEGELPRALASGLVAQGIGSGAPAGAPAGAASGEVGGAAASMGVPINVNVASATELEALPGVGPALAARIVAYRDSNGPFASADDLIAVSGIGAKTLARFRDRVAVR